MKDSTNTTSPITTDEYQDFVETTWRGADSAIEEELRILLGLIGEASEAGDLVKKWYRDFDTPKNIGADKFRELMRKELGDTAYYLAKACTFYDFTLDEILKENIGKLTKRKEEGTIIGSGDER